MAIDKTLSSGSTPMLILKLLSEKDMYGYEMIDTLRQRSGNVFEMKAGTLYPLLHSLEQKNLLTAYEQEVSGKVRRYYRITKEGRKALEEKQAQWQEYARAVTDVMGLARAALLAGRTDTVRAALLEGRTDTARAALPEGRTDTAGKAPAAECRRIVRRKTEKDVSGAMGNFKEGWT